MGKCDKGGRQKSTAAAFSREQIFRWPLLPYGDLANKGLYECPATALLPDAIWQRRWRNQERKAVHAI